MKLPFSDKFMTSVKKLAMNVLAEVLEELAVQVRAMANAEQVTEEAPAQEKTTNDAKSIIA